MILIPCLPLYQLLEHDLNSTLRTLHVLRRGHGSVLFAVNKEIQSHTELHRSLVNLCRYSPQYFQMAEHQSRNDKHYLDVLINRTDKFTLNDEHKALIIHPNNTRYYATGNSEFLYQVKSKRELAFLVHDQLL